MAFERQPIHPAHVINYLVSGRAGRNDDKVADRHIGRYLAVPAGVGSAIDVPCGTGYGSAILYAKGYDVVGVDKAPKPIENARRTYAHCWFVRSSIEGYVPGGAFDIGVCFEGLEHLEDPAAFVERMPDIAPVWYLSVPVGVENEHHLHVYNSEDDVRRLLTAGFAGVTRDKDAGVWVCRAHSACAASRRACLWPLAKEKPTCHCRTPSK